MGDLSTQAPVVSVIIATYNWSSVLRYSIQSALWQTFQDFELLVIGDGCTDDSEQVVASFADPRITWLNLPENSGSQSAPNNKGIELARGEYIAYLGHDDVWHPTHLDILVNTIKEEGADVAYSVAQLFSPLANPQRILTGLSVSGGFEANMSLPPSAVLHGRHVVQEVGGWRDYREIRLPPDLEFFWRAYQHGKLFAGSNELTVFKFPSAQRPNSYIEKRSNEQAECTRQIQENPEFRYRELMRIVSLPIYVKRAFATIVEIPGDAKPGEVVEAYRAVRGLYPKEVRAIEERPLYADYQALHSCNLPTDIAPLEARRQLHQMRILPPDGIFVGYNWYGVEVDEWGCPFRWARNDAEIIITQPTETYKRIALEIALGPGVHSQTATLQLRDTDDNVVAEIDIERSQLVEFDLPLVAGDGAVVKLHIDGGDQVETDGRFLNFRVFNINWVEAIRIAKLERNIESLNAQLVQILTDADNLRTTVVEKNQQLQTIQAALATHERATIQAQQQYISLETAFHEEFTVLRDTVAQLDSFRTTSLRYWWHRIRTSPKLRRWLNR